MRRRLPIGIQDFAKIREGGFLYIDKTARIHEILTGSGGVFFLSRPRRFGKSLLCSTMRAIFEGQRELFKGLAIDSLPWDWKTYPVVHIDLNPGNYEKSIDEMMVTIKTGLRLSAENWGVPVEGETISDRLRLLIVNLARKFNEKVVVIIDEYDKPLLSTIADRELHTKIRSELKGFYGVIKSCDASIRFVFLTGVTKFAQVSIFSDLNQIVDISLNPRYADLCGITQEELEQDFEPEIGEVLQETGKTRDEYLSELRRFYNGYRFSKKPLTVYNPFGLLQHFDNSGEFASYWYETGTPTFLIQLIERQRVDILHLENNLVGDDDFRRYDAETLEALPLLYQTGYLTIVDYDAERKKFTLDYPNEEVRGSFTKSLMVQYCHVPGDELRPFLSRLTDAVYDGDVEGIINALRPFFKSIPSDLYIKHEKCYEMVVYLVFRMLGLRCRSEVRLADGRIDALLETKRYVYCFEFKIDKSAEEALKQIDTKEYLLPWTGSGKKLFKVGVNFDHEKRNITEWKVAEQT